MSKKRNDWESITCLTPKANQNLFVKQIQSKEKFFYQKNIFLEKREEDWTENEKMLFNCSHYCD